MPATLASWPLAELPTISVVQDLLDSPTTSCVQPLIFFHLYNLSVLASSPLLSRTHALRLRIPGRLIACLLHAGRQPPPLPLITFLDLSTSRVRIEDAHSLLRGLPHLRHLVLDHCGLLEDADEPDWGAFAYHGMLACNGLALEETVNEQLAALGGASFTGYPRQREVRILPRASALRTLSLSVPAHVDADARHVLLDAFRHGWAEAVALFNRLVCAARRSRSEEGVLMLRFPLPGEAGNVLREYVFPGMVVVNDDEEFERLTMVRDEKDCPVVCLAGQNGRGEGIEHAEGCGHSIGWDIWEDTS